MLQDEILYKMQGAHQVSFCLFQSCCHEFPFVTLYMQKISFGFMIKNLLAQVKNERR